MSADSIEVEPGIIMREYEAPVDLVFEAWTSVEHLQNWMFPFEGFSCEYTVDDIRPGGSTLHRMTAPNGFQMWLLTRFEELERPNRIVFRQYLSNAAGDILPNQQMPDWPREMRTTILLEEAGAATRLTLLWQPVDPTEAEATAFNASRPDPEKGWGGGLTQLTAYLATL